MEELEGRSVLVVGGSRGLGLGLVEALVERKARVTVLARDASRLAELKQRLGVGVVAGDATDRELAGSLLRDLRPSVLVLNAGSAPEMLPLHEQSWEGFSAIWENDVKAGFHWLQLALRLPLSPGSRVLVSSSGAARNGSPLSGGYAGAKRMLWLMAGYANGISAELGLGLQFQVLVPLQMVGGTGIGGQAAEAYAKKKAISAEAFLASFGKALPPRQYGEHVVSILSDPAHAGGVAFGIKGDTGIVALDSA